MKKSENLSKKHHLGIEANACKTGRGISHRVEVNPDVMGTKTVADGELCHPALTGVHAESVKTRACEGLVGEGEGMDSGGIGGRSGRKKAEEWDLPVSRKYYAKLKAKVEQIYLDLGHAVSWAEPVMKWINLYLRDGDKPQHRYTDEHVMCVFFSLRPEIDEAVRRSALARQRAAERRARKLTKEECVQAECRAREMAEEECVQAGSQANAVHGYSRRRERVSAGHRFLRNPVHRSAAEMCRESEIEKAEMSAGHRFTILNCIYHNDNPS